MLNILFLFFNHFQGILLCGGVSSNKIFLNEKMKHFSFFSFENKFLDETTSHNIALKMVWEKK